MREELFGKESNGFLRDMKISKANVDGTKVLLVDDVVKSVYPPSEGGYWKHMVPQGLERKELEVLLLGVGAGTIARLLLEKYPQAKITGVDNNSLVMDAAVREFDLEKIKMEIVFEDGFDYIEKNRKMFDLIIVDMWNGFWFPFKVLTKEFVDNCMKHLNQEGQVYINAPNLDSIAQEALTGLNAYKDDIGRNVIYRWKLTK